MNSVLKFIGFFLISTVFLSCKDDDNSSALSEPMLRIKIKVDPSQERLGNNGTVEAMPSGNAGQNPEFNTIGAHYIEFAPTANTLLGDGQIVYYAPETIAGGSNAVDFEASRKILPGSDFIEIPLSSLAVGSYKWVRMSLTYQNYDVDFYYNNTGYRGTLASFVGFNTYIKNYKIGQEQISLNANKSQGYWGFESQFNTLTGQAPQGSTTVVNPLFSTSPIPAGSCVVTGDFDTSLVITGQESEDIEVTLSLSTNKSFEWVDTNGNGKWDVNTGAIEQVVDMGLRGLEPSF